MFLSRIRWRLSTQFKNNRNLDLTRAIEIQFGVFIFIDGEAETQASLLLGCPSHTDLASNPRSNAHQLYSLSR